MSSFRGDPRLSSHVFPSPFYHVSNLLFSLSLPPVSHSIHLPSPSGLERDLRLPGGNIFHRALSWPYAEPDTGRWGVETRHARVLLCGAGAVRGGGVSGVPGHNAAMAVLEQD
ncbi:hypothetical protein GCM10017687_04590 [Streptomyces echinatus]